MKILKYTFDIPRLIVEDGELVEMGNTQETYTFTLLFKGVDLYEKLTGRSLLTDISKYTNADNIDFNIVKDIAKASFVKIDGDAFHQNMVTAEDFSKTLAFSKIGTDTEFMTDLIEMVIDCCVPKAQSQNLKAQASKK